MNIYNWSTLHYLKKSWIVLIICCCCCWRKDLACVLSQRAWSGVWWWKMQGYLLRVREMKGGLICTWLDFQRGAHRRGTWAIRAFSRAIEVTRLSAPVRWAGSALRLPQRLEYEKKSRSKKDWAKFNLLLRSFFRSVWPCTRRWFQALPKWWELHAKPLAFPFSQSKGCSDLTSACVCWEMEFVLGENNTSESVLLPYVKKKPQQTKQVEGQKF